MAVCGLEAIADFTKDEGKASRYRESARKIRRYVSENCMTKEGAFASVANGEHVDVSAALFPVWSYTAPDTADMKATIAMLERDYADGDLYRRHLESFDTRREGAFLAGTFWVAHYWVLRNDLERARRILDAGLNCANDLGLFAEEQDTANGNMLGNFPQGFVHAAFINAVSDLGAALAGRSPIGREQK
jgi:GH15 family glucan-1,4-alpha-glucosidase